MHGIQPQELSVKTTLMPIIAAVAALVLTGCAQLRHGGWVKFVREYDGPRDEVIYTNVVSLTRAGMNDYRVWGQLGTRASTNHIIEFKEQREVRPVIYTDVKPGEGNWVRLIMDPETKRGTRVESMEYHVRSKDDVDPRLQYIASKK
jgi:hypothetical protein